MLSLEQGPIRLQGLLNTVEVEISGKVQYYDGQKFIPSVVMTLEGDLTQIAITGPDGAFRFLVVPGGGEN